jgi:sec-independent protein translocase protein TatC
VITTLMFGLAFEMPLILILLALMGIIDAAFLRKHRRYAVVILAVVAAVLTPPDVLSMAMMLVPMYILYEISIIVISMMANKAKQDQLNQT